MIELLSNRIEQISELRGEDSSFSPIFLAWEQLASSTLGEIFGSNSNELKQFKEICYYHGNYDSEAEHHKDYLKGLDQASILLRGYKDLIEVKMKMKSEQSIAKKSNIDDLITVFDKFHRVTRQLRSRYNDRPSLDVEDEYDVQDLLHSLLHIYFDDIRPEEWTPSYAGSSARMDFLLKNENTVIEVKKTRPSLKDKDIGEQLIIDIAKYKEHPFCEKLICFVYDPDGYIRNPRAIENDLSNIGGEMTVQVFIRPRS